MAFRSVLFSVLLLFAVVPQLHAEDSNEVYRLSPEELASRPYDIKFIDEITAHHRMGIEMSRIAVEKAYRADLRKMAQKMIQDQKKDISKLERLARIRHPTAPRIKDMSVGMNINRLRSLSGPEFDVAFLDSMIQHHPGAAYLGIEAQTRAQHLELKKIASKIANAQVSELRQMRKMRDAWSGK